MVPLTPDQIRAAAKEIAIAAHSIVGWEVYASRIERLVNEAVSRAEAAQETQMRELFRWD